MGGGGGGGRSLETKYDILYMSNTILKSVIFLFVTSSLGNIQHGITLYS